MKMRRTTIAVALCALAGAIAPMLAAQGMSATASLEPTSGNATRGSVTFTQQSDKVTMVAKVSGIAPGSHGFHIHEKGDCSAPTE
jgi:Cu-Zn family superoxide dismutase